MFFERENRSVLGLAFDDTLVEDQTMQFFRIDIVTNMSLMKMLTGA